MPRRRSNPYVETVHGKCGHICGISPRFLDMVICDYCTRDVRKEDPSADEVWVPIRKGETTVKRKLSKPKVDKYAPGKTIPLFDVDKPFYLGNWPEPFPPDERG